MESKAFCTTVGRTVDRKACKGCYDGKGINSGTNVLYLSINVEKEETRKEKR
jgi:hypothetical protein